MTASTAAPPAALDPRVAADADEFAARFAAAQPFRHVVIDDFFTPDLVQELVATFPAFDDRKALNEQGLVGNKAVHEKITRLGPAWRRLDALVSSPPFLDLVGHITGIDDLCYDPHYTGGGTHDNRHGQALNPHIDFNYHPVTRQHRRLNLIVYLNERWDDGWGGEIQLHRDPYAPRGHDQVVSIPPLFNRCVIFETNEHSWHGFPKIRLPEDERHRSRKSFALYYYTDTRPPDETAGEHSTVYVELPLPERFAAGHTLDQDDVQEVLELLAQRDQHLRRLYSKLRELWAEIDEIRPRRPAPPRRAGRVVDLVAGDRAAAPAQAPADREVT